MKYTIIVQGRPVPQPRHDVFFNAKTSKQRHVFNTPRVKAWKDLIALQCAAGNMPRGITTPVSVYIEFRFCRPKSHFDKDHNLRAGYSDPRVSLGQKGAQACGDGDNLEKAVWDALQQKGVFENDVQVWDRQSQSIWVSDPRLEGATITLLTDAPAPKQPEKINEEQSNETKKRPTTIC